MAKHDGGGFRKMVFMGEPCVEGSTVATFKRSHLPVYGVKPHLSQSRADTRMLMTFSSRCLFFQPFLEIDPRMRNEKGAGRQIAA